mgnify:CR=1 FL=1
MGEWKSPIETDPFTVAITDKVALLLAANESALKVKGIRNVTSSMFFLREEKSLMTSDGSFLVQTIYRTSPSMSVSKPRSMPSSPPNGEASAGGGKGGDSRRVSWKP